MQILVAALIALLVMTQYLLWVDEDGVRQTYALRISVQAQTEENAALNERNRALEADIKDLKTGLMAIEERARSEMGMIRRDETFYRFLEQPTPKSTERNSAQQTDSSDAPNPARSTAARSLAPPAKSTALARSTRPTKPTATAKSSTRTDSAPSAPPGKAGSTASHP